jgi:glycine cleavage system regulatory protein
VFDVKFVSLSNELTFAKLVNNDNSKIINDFTSLFSKNELTFTSNHMSKSSENKIY